jgi:prepilin-type N-terminal cleavage/methylation domain-containing protein
MKPSGKISKRAFTLVELLTVMAIIGILAAITMGIYGAVKRKGVEFRLKAELAAIELALEAYKAQPENNNLYPHSEPWGYEYPPKDWSGPGPEVDVLNQLYRDLVTEPLKKGQKPYLPNVKESQHDGDSLLAPVSDVRGGAPFVKWYYNNSDPRFAGTEFKSGYDLWVEYGDLGKDKKKASDDTVRIISNWNN